MSPSRRVLFSLEFRKVGRLAIECDGVKTRHTRQSAICLLRCGNSPQSVGKKEPGGLRRPVALNGAVSAQLYDFLHSGLVRLGRPSLANCSGVKPSVCFTSGTSLTALLTRSPFGNST